MNSDSTTARYPWNRYWVPREGTISFDHDGLLVPPRTSRNPHYLNPGDVVEFDQIADFPCLALLGEPGIGKSYAIENVRIENLRSSEAEGGKFFFLDLRSHSDEQRLLNALLGSDEFKWWRVGGRQLTICLDSLDECLLRLETLASLLADEFGKLPGVNGLRLRIACRTQNWPEVLESGLRNCWGEGFRAYELAPLTGEHVKTALSFHGIREETFFSEMRRREVASLAQKPLTLDLLIRIWKKHRGRLPSSRRELFQQGCLLLCEENNESRKSSRRTGSLAPKERYVLAARLAATSIFCNRSAAWAGSEADAPESDFGLSKVAIGFAEVDGRSIGVTERNLREVLETGLFSSRGLHRAGWAHQAYAEFLASEFVELNGLSPRQTSDLLFHPFGDQPKLVPQLRETAAWIASTQPAFFELLLDIEPEALLASDLSNRDPADMKRIIEKFLERVASDSLRPDDAITRRYPKLEYKGLADQLALWINDPLRGISARCEAMDIAGACELDSVVRQLPAIALNHDEPERVRILAAAWVSRAGRPGTRKQLRDLALGKVTVDTDLRLRGSALRACFPATVTAQEIFDTLVPPSSELIGAYNMFVSYELLEKLQDRDLPIALAWVEAQASNQYLGDDFCDLRNNILNKASAFFNQRPIRHAFARIVFRQLRHYCEIGDELAQKWLSWLDCHERERREIAWERFDALEKEDEPGDLADRRIGLFRGEDLSLLISRLRATRSARRQNALCNVIQRIANFTIVKDIDSLIVATKTCAPLKRFFAGWMDPWPLKGEMAKKERARHIEREAITARTRKKPPRTEELNEEARQRLFKCQNGMPQQWWRISRLFEFDDYGHQHHGDWDVTLLHGWKRADETIRHDVLRGALPYLKNFASNPSEWFEENNMTYLPSVAALRAIRLLRYHAPDDYAQLTPQDWSRWMPSVLREPNYSDSSGTADITLDAYFAAPQSFIRWLRRVIRQENRRNDSLSVLHRLIIEIKGCWNPELPKGLQRQLVDRYLAHIPSRHGIYLIADFRCEFWDDVDGRKKQSLKVVDHLPTLQAEAKGLRERGWHVEVITVNMRRPAPARSARVQAGCRLTPLRRAKRGSLM
jgi:hypothetical protein